MLMRSFLFVDDERAVADIDTWGVEKFESSALVTILHPALVEMLQAQWVFLLDAFAKSVEIRSEDPDLLLDDNYFDMNPGERRVRILRGSAENPSVRSVYDM